MIQDLQYAIRMMFKRPGFSLVAIVTLALGIGASTAMFTVLDGVLLKPLRYRDADRIVALNTGWANGKTTRRLTGGDLIDIRDKSGVFDSLASYQGGEMGVQVANRAEFVPTYIVAPDFTNVFSPTPLAGRLFNKDDEKVSAIVGAGFAQRNFGSAPSAVGQNLKFEGRSYLVVGVLPDSFHFPAKAELWLAGPSQPENVNRSSFNYPTVAKLKSGITLEEANSRLKSLANGLAQQFPDTNKNKSLVAVELREQLVGSVRTTLFFLMGAVGLVLLIACANVANLLLARATGRTQEMAVRSALGATAGRIIRQLLMESLALAIAAAVLGIAIAEAATSLLLAGNAKTIPLPRLADVTLDARVLLFTLAVASAASIGFGLAPALSAARINLYDALKVKGIGGLMGGTSRLRNFLVVAQIALSFVLVIGAGLLFRSFVAMAENDLGFRTDGMLVMYAHIPATTKDEYARVPSVQSEMFEKLKQIPGVISVAGAMGLPAGQYSSDGYYAVKGKTSFEGDYRKLPQSGFRLASPNYFSTLAIPMLRGRDFTDSDQQSSEPVVIISAALAKQSFAGEDPIGQTIICGLDDESGKGMRVIGVVGDVRTDSPAADKSAEMYMPLAQHVYRANEFEVVMRTQVEPASLTQTVQDTVRRISPAIATRFTTLNVMVSDSIAAPRFRMTLATSFAGLALLLAIAGVYAVMSYVTAQRTQEFALRAALGARPANIASLVLGRTSRLAAIGVAVGVALAMASSRVLASMLYGIKTTDATTYAIVLVMVIPLIVLAAAVPAYRASRVDPMQALRYE